jgi:hypothetical protein
MEEVRTILATLDTAKAQSAFLQSFLEDVLFWEKPFSPTSKRRKPLKNNISRNQLSYVSDEDQDERKTNWKKTIDPASKRTYWYHSKTRQTQWEKPQQVLSIERQLKLQLLKTRKEFFHEMEKNLLESLKRGELIPGIKEKKYSRTATPRESKTHHIRTISTMDGNYLLAELRDDQNEADASYVRLEAKKQSSSKESKGRPPLFQQEFWKKVPRPQHHPLSSSTPPFSGDSIDQESAATTTITNNGYHHARRNTGGTIFLQNTMTKPDISATVKAVCGVYRSHIVQNASQKKGPKNKFFVKLFWDEQGTIVIRPSVPSLSEVKHFYQEFYSRSKMEHDTIIMSLIYVERLVKCTHGAVSPQPENWRSILFASMVLASKVWDDLSMWNLDFANVSTTFGKGFSLNRINELELAMLKNLQFNVRVSASQYAKYYFLMRNLCIRSGLVQEGLCTKAELPAQQERASKKNTHKQRSKSMDQNFFNSHCLDNNDQRKKATGPVFSDSVCLEQLLVGS